MQAVFFKDVSVLVTYYLVNIKLRFTVIPSLATEILKEIAENNYNVLWGTTRYGATRCMHVTYSTINKIK